MNDSFEVELPVERVLGALRAGNIQNIAEALERADVGAVAVALRDRNPHRIVEALRGGNFEAVVEAFFACDEEKLEQVRRGRDAVRVAAALRSRNSHKLATALRGRDTARIIRSLATRDPDAIASALLDRSGSKPLSDADVSRILQSIPQSNDELARLADNVQSRQPMHAFEPLAVDEVKQILSALQDHDVGRIGKALRNRLRDLWTVTYQQVLPKVKAALWRNLGGTGALNVEEKVESITASVWRTVLRNAQEGTTHDWELQTMDDFASILIRIAWRKAAHRIYTGKMVQPEPFPVDPTFLEPIDPGPDPVEELIEQELKTEIGAFGESLDCVDRVILKLKLAGEKTHKEIADEVVKRCGYNRCSTKLIQRHWNDIAERLCQRLASFDPSNE